MKLGTAKTIRTLFTLLCLLATSVVTIATSRKGDRYDGQPAPYIRTEATERKDYDVASNCPQSVPQERITIANEQITYPSQMYFSDFGLPTQTLNLDYNEEVNGDVNGLYRTCRRSELKDQNTTLIVYTCSENNKRVCQISFEPVQ